MFCLKFHLMRKVQRGPARGRCSSLQFFCTRLPSVLFELDRYRGARMCFFLRAGVLICGFFFCLAPVLKGADRAWADNLFRGSAGEGIIVAVAGPMSGRFSERYRALIRGVRRAVRGNAPAWSVRLISFDDQCSAQGARKAARQVVA